jgi:hypothetical protein
LQVFSTVLVLEVIMKNKLLIYCSGLKSELLVESTNKGCFRLEVSVIGFGSVEKQAPMNAIRLSIYLRIFKNLPINFYNIPQFYHLTR